MLSIMQMVIHSITTLLTSCVSHRALTAKSTQTYTEHRSIVNTWPPSGLSLQSGTPPKRVGAGTQSMLVRAGKIARRLKRFVSSVGRLSPPSITMRASALPNAVNGTGRFRRDAIETRCALSAAKSSSALLAPKHARVNAVHVSDGIVRPVYNLKVEGEPEFFANGVLVHNCDASSGAYNKLLNQRRTSHKIQGFGR